MRLALASTVIRRIAIHYPTRRVRAGADDLHT